MSFSKLAFFGSLALILSASRGSLAANKRASKILDYEMINNKIEIDNTTDPGIFKSDFEKLTNNSDFIY